MRRLPEILTANLTNHHRTISRSPMKTKHPLWLLSQLLALTAAPLIASGEPAAKTPSHLADYIRPFVGTEGEGNTYPGPSAPFGMIQLSPDTDTTNWGTASGYEYSDPTIQGFSLTHLSGTGCPDLGDFLFVPQV